MNVIAFHPKHNSLFKKDVTGAFKPEAQAFVQKHNYSKANIYEIDCRRKVSKFVRQNQILAELSQFEDKQLDAIAFFCHGWKKGLQFGFSNSAQDLETLSYRILKASANKIRVVLYACSCGSTDLQNFASALRDQIYNWESRPIQIDAHDRKGHCTRRPFIRRYTEPAYSGGKWIIMPKTELWNNWVNALDETDLRFDYPFMTIQKIYNHLKKL